MRKYRFFNILLIVILIAMFILCWQLPNFYTLGVHTFGKISHYAVFESAYIVGSNGEKTNLTFWGTYDGKAQNGGCGTFQGAINVDAYPTPYQGDLSLSDDPEGGILFIVRGDYLQAYHLSAAPQTVDGETQFTPSGNWYTVVLNPKAPEEIIVIAYDEDNTALGVVVNADTQEEADRIYQAYINNMQGQ